MRGFRVRFFGRLHLRRVVHCEQLLFTAVECAQAFPEGGQARGGVVPGLDGGQLPDRASVSLKGERHFGIGQRREGQVVLDVGGLRFLGAQKLPPRRQIEEELAHLHGGSRRAARGFDLHDLAAADDNLRPLGRVAGPLARGEGEAAHAGDAGQRLAAKTHRGNGREVFGPPDFAGGVAFQAEQRVVAAHAEAVVHHAHQAAPARLDFHRHARGLRVQRVLDQFLHHAGRALNHFAGGDLIGHLLGQQADAVHILVTRLHELHRYIRSVLPPPLVTL